MEELSVTFPGGMRVDVAYKGHLVRTDQPAYAGGGGEAPSPFDLFLASIAACAGFYLLAFCRERNIPLEKAGVRMSGERDPQSRMVSRVTIELNLPLGFPDKYRQAVIKAVDTCTVKNHILTPPAFLITARPSE